MSTSVLAGIDLHSESFRRDPYAAYDLLREAMPVLHIPRGDFRMVFRYDTVKRVLNDHETFSSSMFNAGRANPDWFFFADPPRHTRLRALISHAFTPRMIAGMEPRIDRMVTDLLDPLMERGAMDIAADLAIPLPAMVIAEMLGVPLADRARVTGWSDVMMTLSYSVSGGPQAEAASKAYFAATDEMAAWLAELMEQRRSAPKPDLLTGLMQAEVEGERLTPKEILGFVQLLLAAGTETTTNVIDNAMVCFLEHPEQVARLREKPELLPSAIEEVLRYRSPLAFVFRATMREVELDGVAIPAGKVVLPMLGSANRDPRQFANPNVFDIARNPNPHIVFGHGIHFCIGAALSRLESRVALAQILRRMASFEAASAEPWQPRQGLHVHGPVRLPIRFTAN